MKILVADDDRISRMLMERMLQQSGYEVVTAEDGLQAAAELEKPGGPRLALLDWMMPGLDGPGLCRAIRSKQDDAYIYIMLLTSRESSADIVKGLEAGADDYLTKPCNSAELRARLHTGRRILQLEDKLVEAREEMRFKATHDPLTSLWDRGAILSLLRSELSRARRERSPVSILLCDVDHFKKINDVHGHHAGDLVLEEVATRLMDAVRTHDAVGRYGGEEFLIVLGGCGHAHLQERAEQVRKSIYSSPFTIDQGAITVSLSLGAITVDLWEKSAPIELLLKQVDMALYQAKASGRNRVVYAEMAAVAADNVRREVSSLPVNLPLSRLIEA
ncbi:response regulator receiver modulated diguanylate cyclase [Granulicella rosea]|uniref:diguanylate cyclase n=1 Tax=Granulicella rosea TaxID=474952 RepID=A0A239MQ12_9BACT|nr:diguanylate cyclase [Granulicella rosea]SNT43929.1 response regulator receiver modulated diguanylate cyclase [Granulicella rosea]